MKAFSSFFKTIIPICVCLLLIGCSNSRNRYSNSPDGQVPKVNVPLDSPGMSYDGANSDGDATHGAPLSPAPTVHGKPSLIKMYVENSESMFGYVRKRSDSEETTFVEDLNEIAQLPIFVDQKIPVDIWYVNGARPIKTNHIGYSFGNKLNIEGMRCGDITLSDLNTMFDTILSGAQNGIITILVSDGIYDIGNGSSLGTEGKTTRTNFINKLNNSTSNLQTLLVKMSSQFKGKYFYVSKRGSVNLDQQRPYYIWIIGDSDMINTYFSDEALKKLNGYQNHVRYVKVGNNVLPFEIDFSDCVGKFMPDKKDSHVLTKHEAYHGQFELALIVDYGDLYYPDAYLTDCKNYSCDFNFNVSSITKATPTQVTSAGVSYKRPFLIKVTTSQPNPRGKLTLQLKNTQPSWINASNAPNENVIDTNTTYGFSTLTKGIREAYEYVSDSIPAVFEITFN